MSQENVEIVREGYERFAATGEFVAELATDDFVWDMSNFHGWPEQQVYEGVDGAGTFLSEWMDAWEDWELELEALHDAGDRVVALVHQRAGRNRAECQSRCPSPRSSRSATASRPGWRCTRTGTRPSKRPGYGSSPLLGAAAGLLVDGAVGRRQGLESLVGDLLAADDRDPVGTGGETRLGALDGGELLLVILGEACVPLILIQALVALVTRLDSIIGLFGLLGLDAGDRLLDSSSFGRKQFARTLRFHVKTVSLSDAFPWADIRHR
jgi:ketosteroid isomerase-like protein